MRIQHNIMAMNAYRNYNLNTSALSKNLEKLSSGYKINRAGDDAAGLAISEKMRAQITGLEAAQKNVKDGVSLVKTAEGAMQEIQDMLNRMDYLATQSANGTYQDEVDRENLQLEVEQLRSEINRIADSANFNGIKLLDGSLEKGAIGGVKYESVDAETIVGMLPEEGDPEQVTVDGEKTILESDANGGDKASFEIRLDGLSSTNKETNGTFQLKLGDFSFEKVQVSGKMSSKALAEAVAKANKKVTINGSEYDVTAKDGKLVFTGDADSDVVTIKNSKVTFDFNKGEYEGPASYTSGKYEAGTGTNGDAKMTIDIQDANGTSLLGSSIDSDTFDEEATAAEVAEALNNALADANIEGVEVIANEDDTFTVNVTNEDYLAAGVDSITLTYDGGTADNGVFNDTMVNDNKTLASKSWQTDAFTAEAGLTGTPTPGKMALTIGDVTVETADYAYGDDVDDIAEKLQAAIDADANLKGKVSVTGDTGTKKFTVTITDADLAAKTVETPSMDFTASSGGTGSATANTGVFAGGTTGAEISADAPLYNEGTANLGSYTKGTDSTNTATVTVAIKDKDGTSLGTVTTSSAIKGNSTLDEIVADLNTEAATAGVDVTFSNENGTLKMTINDETIGQSAETVDIDYTPATNDNTTDGVGFKKQAGIEVDKGPGLTGTINGGVQNVETPASAVGNNLANTTIDLSDYFTDGTKITLGDTTYTVAVGAESKFKDAKNVIDLTDMEDDTLDAAEAARRLSQAAKGNNGVFSVGQNDNGLTTLQQLQSAKNTTDMTTMEKLASYIKISKADPASVETAKPGKGLTLQIGDTSDSFNQMEVSVGDMHTSAMGTEGGASIADINVGTQEGAQAAVQTIKDAINYVSSVRGTLGATQNRLEHTANNLSVMAENIQDAESTIRDTDVAEEMMSYVKNNILVQSAQAMLAQANQVPQGVLQLLG